MKATLLELTEFANKHDLVTEHDIERETDIIDLEKMKKILTTQVKTLTGWVILDGHYAHEAVDPKLVFKVFVMRRAPWVLKEELSVRNYPLSKVWENIESELVGICSSETRHIFHEETVCEIDTTNMMASETLENILEILSEDEKCLEAPVDWMQYHETEILLREKPRCI